MLDAKKIVKVPIISLMAQNPTKMYFAQPTLLNLVRTILPTYLLATKQIFRSVKFLAKSSWQMGKEATRALPESQDCP